MMSDWNRFRPYRKGDLPKVWASLRQEDFREYSAIDFTDPALIETYLRGAARRMQTWDSDIGPLCVLGVTPDNDPGVGHIWAIASEHARPRWRFAVRETDRQLKRLGRGYSLLTNHKDTRNKGQIEWLRRLGFTFFRTDADFMGSGIPFHQFVRIVK